MNTHSDPLLANILLVDDDPGTIQVLEKALNDLGTIRFALNGQEALRMAREEPPDLIMLDGAMPGMSGFEVCQLLKSDQELAHIPVIFVTSYTQLEFEETSFDCGASDFINKPIRPSIVAARAKTQIKLKRFTDRLQMLSSTDALTGLPNRRAFNEALEREWARMNRSGEPLSLLMIDVDHFKRFNDLYGHPAGDICLAQVGKALKAQLRRPADLAARYGGEEFALLLPATDHQGAMELAQRVLAAVQDLGLVHGDSDCGKHVTISTGVSSYDQACPLWAVGQDVTTSSVANGVSSADLLVCADGALYAAKKAGRDRCMSMAIENVVQLRLSNASLAPTRP